MNPLVKDRISGALLFLLAVFIWLTIPYQIEDPGVTAMGPRFFPKFLSVALMLLSGSLIVGSFTKRPKNVKSEYAEIKQTIKLNDEVRVLIVFVIMIIYISIMELLGFIVSTIVALGVVMYILKVRKWYHYLIFVLVTMGIYYIFEKIMYVQLP